MKKIGIIVLIVVLTLGVIGVGYAAWSQNLVITGNATAAKFAVSMVNIGDGSAVAPTTILVSAKNPQSFTITINKLIPNSVETVAFQIYNNSDIPVNVTGGITGNTIPLNISDSAPASIAAGATVSDMLTITTPNWTNQDNQGASETFTYTITAAQ